MNSFCCGRGGGGVNGYFLELHNLEVACSNHLPLDGVVTLLYPGEWSCVSGNLYH